MDTKILKTLDDIKKLLILDLIARGVQSKDIAHVLGLDKSRITQIVPARKIKVNKTDEKI